MADSPLARCTLRVIHAREPSMQLLSLRSRWRKNCGRWRWWPAGRSAGARVFGGANAPTLTGLSREFLPASVHCALIDMRIVGEECFLTYRIKRQRRRPS